nr:uncharacterized protein LOC109175453 [Ipomoea batatas]
MWKLLRKFILFPDCLEHFGVHHPSLCPFCWCAIAAAKRPSLTKVDSSLLVHFIKPTLPHAPWLIGSVVCRIQGLSVSSLKKVLKVQPRTIVHTRVQEGENEESVGSSDDVVPPQGEEASSFHITLCDETPIEGEDAEEAPHELEEGVRAAIDELKEVDLGTPENPRPIFISTLLSNEDE